MSKNIFIGILSLPGDGTGINKRVCNEENVSHILASYVKLVEGGGARVVPLMYNEPMESFTKKLNSVHGIILTGGRPPEGDCLKAVKRIIGHAIKMNREGQYFPLVGICLGFQLLVQIVSKDDSFFHEKSEFNALNYSAPLKVITPDPDAPLSYFPKELLDEMKNQPLPYYNNRRGVSADRFEANKELVKFFKILTSTKDGDDKEFISTIRALKFPIYGVQWHPEKHCYEFAEKSRAAHSDSGTKITQSFSRFIVGEARKSNLVPDNKYMLSQLINNHPIAFSGKNGIGPDEVYYFTADPPS